MPRIIFKINNKKVNVFWGKIAQAKGKEGVLKDGRKIRKEGNEWVYEAK